MDRTTEPLAGTGHRRVLRLRGSWRWGRSLLSIAGVATLLVLVVPLVAGAPWGQVVAALTSVPVLELGGLALLWIAGLYAHTFTLTAALPRLTHRRALALSLTGSAVSNVLPFGGAAGIALNYRMTRTWGFDRPAFAAYTVVTNVWDILVKLCLPALALAGLVLSGQATGGAWSPRPRSPPACWRWSRWSARSCWPATGPRSRWGLGRPDPGRPAAAGAGRAARSGSARRCCGSGPSAARSCGPAGRA